MLLVESGFQPSPVGKTHRYLCSDLWFLFPLVKNLSLALGPLIPWTPLGRYSHKSCPLWSPHSQIPARNAGGLVSAAITKRLLRLAYSTTSLMPRSCVFDIRQTEMTSYATNTWPLLGLPFPSCPRQPPAECQMFIRHQLAKEADFQAEWPFWGLSDGKVAFGNALALSNSVKN